MSCLLFRLEVFAGAGIAEVCDKLKDINRVLGVTCRCNFNGVDLMFCDGDDPEIMRKQYKEILLSNSDYKTATGH